MDTTNEMFLDDDGNGNVRRYYIVSGVRTYANNTQGTTSFELGVTVNSITVEAEPLIFDIEAMFNEFSVIWPVS